MYCSIVASYLVYLFFRRGHKSKKNRGEVTKAAIVKKTTRTWRSRRPLGSKQPPCLFRKLPLKDNHRVFGECPQMDVKSELSLHLKCWLGAVRRGDANRTGNTWSGGGGAAEQLHRTPRKINIQIKRWYFIFDTWAATPTSFSAFSETLTFIAGYYPNVVFFLLSISLKLLHTVFNYISSLIGPQRRISSLMGIKIN